MSLSFGTGDITVTLTPEHPKPGDLVHHRTIYGRFGSSRERLVQAICDVIGGHTVYFILKTQDSKHEVVVPVVSWKMPMYCGNGDSSGLLSHLAELLREQETAGHVVSVMGASRRRFDLSYKVHRSGDIPLEAESDDDPAEAVVNTNGVRVITTLRREF